MTKHKIKILGLAAVIVMTGQLNAANRTAVSAKQPDVQAAVSLAQDGDTVLIPNGTESWTSGISTTKQITIRALNYTPTKWGDTTRSVIITNNASGPLFRFTTGNLYHVQMSGIRINEGSNTNNAIEITGNGSKVGLLSDMYFEVNSRFGSAADVALVDWGALGGVIWNSRFVGIGTCCGGSSPGPGPASANFLINSPRAWTTPSTMGTLDVGGGVNVYIEDSSTLNTGCFPDINRNGRAVLRHNKFDGSTGITHGFTTTDAQGRHMEWYDNEFNVSIPERDLGGRYIWQRAGTGVYTNNIVNANAGSNYSEPSFLEMGDNTTPGSYPMYRAMGWGHDGTNEVSDPIYVWNNTGVHASRTGFTGSWGNIVHYDRDVFVDKGPKPGYTKYTYPHPFRSGTIPPPPGDLTPPSVPSNLTAQVISAAQVNLTWTASTDNVGVTGYQVERCQGSTCSNFSQIATPTSASYSNTALVANTTYRYRVRATDAAGNLSNYSAITNGTTAAGGTATFPPLPEGNNGIAAQYSNDSGISANGNVLFFDGFETYTSASQLTSSGNYDNYFQQANLAFDTSMFKGGTKSLRIRMPSTTTDVWNAVVRDFATNSDTIHMRIYVRYQPNYAGVVDAHNGLRISGKYVNSGIRPDGQGGSNGFLVEIEDSRYQGEGEPGYTNAYVYHPEQDDVYGEHWYPDGSVGNGTPNFGNTFTVRSKVIPARGVWICYEMMVKLNIPGSRDGRVAVWRDGTLIADWHNVRFRDVATLKFDQIQLENGGKSSSQQNDKWYDNLVVATSYIGPMQTGTTPPMVYHPADTNNNSIIVLDEIVKYGSCWTNAPAIPTGCPTPVATVDNASRGASIWKNGEAYIYDSTKTCPLCWVTP